MALGLGVIPRVRSQPARAAEIPWDCGVKQERAAWRGGRGGKITGASGGIFLARLFSGSNSTPRFQSHLTEGQMPQGCWKGRETPARAPSGGSPKAPTLPTAENSPSGWWGGRKNGNFTAKKKNEIKKGIWVVKDCKEPGHPSGTRVLQRRRCGGHISSPLPGTRVIQLLAHLCPFIFHGSRVWLQECRSHGEIWEWGHGAEGFAPNLTQGRVDLG